MSHTKARKLRKSQTDSESRLWQKLRNRRLAQCKFRRQHPIGPYVADFVCIEQHLIIEVDGGQHAGQMEKDNRRTAFLASKGFRVVRFWNHEVLTDMDAVLARIFALVSSSSSV